MEEKKILLRLDAETYDKVYKKSKEENRSINGQLVNIIQKSFNPKISVNLGDVVVGLEREK